MSVCRQNKRQNERLPHSARPEEPRNDDHPEGLGSIGKGLSIGFVEDRSRIKEL